MSKLINIAPMADKELKLQDVADYLEELKNVLADIIDEYVIGIIPIILGKGIPLFYEGNPTIRLKLIESITDRGTVILRYLKR